MNSSSGGSLFGVLAFGLGAGLGRELLEDRVRLHFLLNEIAQLEERRLQDEQALLELRRENLLKREVLRLMHPGTGHIREAKQATGS